ncbi:hypothetical protein K437DRAFT_250816 [Tilletiaria anomala UBC 951]|uniref:Nucleoporin Nup186/Nup192/Nup205 n=1 Tax=Tilletiaria anomala (strain ATCC 24038 / CBS 436.72 / UBC 951) TaxID=1037660 RepID=A0A066VKS2_TILAU|nr:uncharacterized protein K437DRAFT_250816 [Tilletiaria anomala UBC 951]KDN39329.1 hypothetical protein K437DRAFT_250816 [Tilletiaria anomala UBC 951]
MAAIFIPQRFERLHQLICDALGDGTSAELTASSSWLVTLDTAREDIAILGRAKPPSEAERKEIEGGSITIDGTTANLQQEFSQQTLHLSQYLSLSERYAASLLQVGLAGRARWARPPTEVAVLLYYRERLALLACLKDLLTALINARNGEAYGALDSIPQVESFLRKLTETKDLPQAVGQKASFTKRILDEIEFTTQEVSKLEKRIHTGGAQALAHLFSDDIFSESIQLLKEQARELGHVLYLLGVAGILRAEGVLVIAKWLEAVPREAFGTNSIYVLTALLGALDASSSLLDDSSFVKSMTALAESASWKTPAIRCAMALQWALQMIGLLKRSTGSSAELRNQEEKVQDLITGAIRGGAFAFFNLNVLAFRHEQEEDHMWFSEEEENGERAAGQPADIDATFQEYILHQIQRLMQGVSSVMLPILRKVQRAEEDAAFASSRGRTDVQEPRHDIQQLFDLIATLCRGRPNAGLDFWTGPDGRATRFLLWAIESREAGHQLSLLDMLAAMSAGAESSLQAHMLLSNHESVSDRFVSWDHLFDWVQYYIDLFAKSPSSQEMPPEEAKLLIAFMRLLRGVAYYSQAARASLYETNEYQVITRLFNLSLCHIHVELKAALLDALAAFAREDSPHAERIGNDIWNRMTKADILGSARSSRPAFGTRPAGGGTGAIHTLEHVEAPQHNYAGTCSLVNFLSVILPQRAALTDDYVQFVTQSVFLQASSREYDHRSDRWKVTSACLAFLYRCLDRFKVEELLTGTGSSPEALAAQPGFLVARHFLTGSPVEKELFAIIGIGFDTSNRAATPLMTKAIELALRCVQRLFDIQDIFLQVLLPALTESSQDQARIGAPTRYSTLDQHLLHQHQTAVDIALYINSTAASVAMLSIKVLGQIASSPAFSAIDRFSVANGRKKMNRLVGLLEMMDETVRIRSGYIERLGNPETSLAVDESGDDFDGGSCSIRVAILDLLLEHVSGNAPNISHLLLGYDVSADTQVISDPDSAATSPGALHTILALLSSEDQSLQSMLSQFPTLTERCFQLLLKLCSEPFSSAATLRYLRTREDFIQSRLPLIPFAPIARRDSDGTAVFANGLALSTSAGAAVSNLRLKADLLGMIALEIHALTSEDMLNATTPILSLLLDAEDGVGIRLLELLSSFDFDWNDNGDNVEEELSLLADLNINLIKLRGAEAVEQEFDLEAAATLLSNARAELQRTGTLREASQASRFEHEAVVIMRYLAARNAHRSIAHARRDALRAWKHTLDMILSRCSMLLRSEDRLVVIFDCLAAILPRITSRSDPATIDLLSGSVLALIATLRVGTEDQKDALPADRLLATLRSLISATLQPGTSTIARGSLYSGLINFLQLASSSTSRTDSYDAAEDVSISGASVAFSAISASSSMVLRVKGLLAEKAEKLVILVARDALDASDVWKTVAYTLLDKLNCLESSRSRPSRILAVLSGQGYLKTMASSLREMDLPLQDTLRPDPPTLTPTYVYEAMMAFAVRLASSRAGAEALLEARMLDALAQSDFLSASPDQDQGFIEADTFLPAVRERQAALMAPALELCFAVYSSTASARQSVLALLNAHHDTLVNVLKAVLRDIVTIGQINLAQLLVTLLGLRMANNEVPTAAETSSFHSHVLGVAAAFLMIDTWRARVVPSNDAEREESSRLNVRESLTAFDVKAIAQVERLQISLLAYLETASQGPRMRPVLTAAVSPQHGLSHPQAFVQRTLAAPSMCTAITSLEEEVEKMSTRLPRLEAVLFALKSPNTVSIDDWEDLLRDEAEVSEQFIADAARQPSLAVSFLKLRLGARRASIAQSLDVIELLMVLLCRHFDYYTSMPHSQLADDNLGPRRTRMDAQSNDRALLLQVGTEKFAGLGDRLVELTLGEAQLPDAQERLAFVEMAMRRIQSLLAERSV